MVVLRSGKKTGEDLDKNIQQITTEENIFMNERTDNELSQLCIPVIKKDDKVLSIKEKVEHLKQRVDTAFDILREKKYFCARNFACCNTCAWAEAPRKFGDNVVFWHEQDESGLIKEGTVYIGWGGDGNYIQKIFKSVGLIVNWNGSNSQRMLLSI